MRSTVDWEKRLSDYKASQAEHRLGHVAAAKRPKVAKAQTASGTIMVCVHNSV